MATKKVYEKWGKILSLIGGLLFILGGILLFLDYFIIVFSIPALASDLVIKTIFFRLLLNLSSSTVILILAIGGIIIGAGTVILVSAEVSDLLTGIVLIILGIIALGLSALFIVIGGVLYLIASFKKR